MSMDKFEEFVRSQGFQGEFQRTPSGQFKSDALHFMEKIWQSRQAEIDEKDKRIGDQKDFIEMALNSLNHLKENAVTHRDYGHECNWVRSFNDLIKLADDAEDALKQVLRGDHDN